METADNLQVVYDELKRAIDGYNDAHKAYALDLRQGMDVGRTRIEFDRAMRRYEMREKTFNREVSKAINAEGKIPALAEDMLNHQRYNGFHAKGLAKIIGDYHRKNQTQTGEGQSVQDLMMSARGEI